MCYCIAVDVNVSSVSIFLLLLHRLMLFFVKAIISPSWIDNGNPAVYVYKIVSYIQAMRLRVRTKLKLRMRVKAGTNPLP